MVNIIDITDRFQQEHWVFNDCDRTVYLSQGRCFSLVGLDWDLEVSCRNSPVVVRGSLMVSTYFITLVYT